MRKSNNKKTRDVTAFIYLRLSRDDNLEGESYSIGNQKKLLTKAAKDLGYSNIVTFIDATVIIGLKQNPTNGRRFSPIFLLYRAFCGAKHRMPL